MSQTEDKTVAEWIIAKQRADFLRDSEAKRLEKYRELDDEEAKLRVEMDDHQTMLEVAAHAESVALVEFQVAQEKLDAIKRQRETARFESSRSKAGSNPSGKSGKGIARQRLMNL